MAIFLTGSTGYIGSYLAAFLLERSAERLNLLVRAKSEREAEERLWRSLQLHFDFPRFHEQLRSRIAIFRGDLTESGFGLDAAAYERLAATTDSILHCAASLNRKSEKACLNTNLRGTLEVVKLGQRVRAAGGLRRISHVSTVAVAGVRSREVVAEDRAIEWDRSDYDPYARTKKFCEHMIRELLLDTPRTIFRPSIVLGDSRRAETSQFEMVRAFVFLARLPVLPLRPGDKIDIVNVDFVADAIVTLHLKEKPQHDIYHLSSGADSETFRQLTDTLGAQGLRRPLYAPSLERPFQWLVDRLARGNSAVGRGATLLKVFLPYIVWNTQFDNTRVASELGRKPAPFSRYAFPLFEYAQRVRFRYPAAPWPADEKVAAGGRAR